MTPAMKRVVTLLVISVCLNYIDRGNLSIAAPLLEGELHISHAQLGILLSAFFWTYATFQLISGWLVDQYDVNWVIALGFLLWSGATAATGFAHGLAALFVMRLILGAGESVAYPSYSKIFARHLPEDRRGFANALIAAGVSLGPTVGIFFGGRLMGRYGWRPFFIVLGLASMLWLIPWAKWKPRASAAIGPVRAETPPEVLAILGLRSAWGTFAGLFCSNYISYFLITWIPYYLKNGRNFSMDQMATIAAGVYLSTAVFAATFGWVSDRWIDAGSTPTLVRKTIISTGLLAAGIFSLASVVTGRRLSIPLLLLASGAYGMAASNIWAITQTIAGPRAAGRWTGIQNFVGNMAGVAAAALTGIVLQRTGKFFWPFAIVAFFGLLGACVYIFVVGPVEEVHWDADVFVRDSSGAI
jgi:MFS transporter, ACS family, D-galactonate transporter